MRRIPYGVRCDGVENTRAQISNTETARSGSAALSAPMEASMISTQPSITRNTFSGIDLDSEESKATVTSLL